MPRTQIDQVVVADTLSVHIARGGPFKNIGTSGYKFQILLIEVLEVCRWHPKKCVDVCIDFSEAGHIDWQCCSAYRVYIGLQI
jgi:hypothetical protein